VPIKVTKTPCNESFTFLSGGAHYKPIGWQKPENEEGRPIKEKTLTCDPYKTKGQATTCITQSKRQLKGKGNSGGSSPNHHPKTKKGNKSFNQCWEGKAAVKTREWGLTKKKRTNNPVVRINVKTWSKPST